MWKDKLISNLPLKVVCKNSPLNSFDDIRQKNVNKIWNVLLLCMETIFKRSLCPFKCNNLSIDKTTQVKNKTNKIGHRAFSQESGIETTQRDSCNITKTHKTESPKEKCTKTRPVCVVNFGYSVQPAKDLILLPLWGSYFIEYLRRFDEKYPTPPWLVLKGWVRAAGPQNVYIVSTGVHNVYK